MMHQVQRAWLDGVEFASAHPALMLQHINEIEPKLTYKSSARFGGGLIEHSRVMDRREITLEFAIREGLDFARRQEAYQAAVAWAYNGGWLRLSDHPGQRIYVSMTKAPALGRLREWTEDMAITFTAAWYPWWENVDAQEVGVTAQASGTVQMHVLGTAPSCLCCSIVPVTGSLTSAIISTPESEMVISLENTPASAGSTVIIAYDDKHIMWIRCGSYNLLRYRTGSDDLILQPGYQPIGYSFNTTCNVTFWNRGVWL